MKTQAYLIRPMTEEDVSRLPEIRPSFVSSTVLVVEKIGAGLESGWRLVERPLPEPFDKGRGYDFDANEQANILRRLRLKTGLHLVAEKDNRLVGILDAIPEEWNSTVWVWNIMLDEGVRGQGIGRELFERTAAWAQRLGYRALVFETQTNNVPACKFYVRMGCELGGIRDSYYTNDDIERNEVALFWVYKLV